MLTIAAFALAMTAQDPNYAGDRPPPAYYPTGPYNGQPVYRPAPVRCQPPSYPRVFQGRVTCVYPHKHRTVHPD